MKLAIGSDHIGYELKLHIIKYLREKGNDVTDLGTYSTDRTDYPVYGKKVASAVLSGECERGILICGTGVGISIAANKMRGIRAVVCSEPYSASLSVRHNNANIVAFGARVVGESIAEAIVDAFLSSQFEGGRHLARVNMLENI